MPDPSPITKPSRSLSNGREAFSGASLRVESARIEQKPPTPSGVIAASAAPGDHHVGVAALDEAEGVAHRVGAARAGGGGGGVRSLGPGADRDPARGEVDDRGGDEERADLAGPALEEGLVLALDGGEAADAAADEDAHPPRLGRVHGEGGVLHREVGGGDRELDEAVDLLDVLLLDPAQGVEALHLAGEAGGVVGGVEQRDGARPRATGEEALPGLLGADPQGRHEPHPRDDDPAVRGHVARASRATSCPSASRCSRRLPGPG